MLNGRLGAQPGHLALGELASSGDGVLNGLIERAFAFEMRPKLAVTDCANGGVSRSEIAASPQPRHFFKKSRAHHFMKSVLQSLMKSCAIARNQCPLMQMYTGQRTASGTLQV